MFSKKSGKNVKITISITILQPEVCEYKEKLFITMKYKPFVAQKYYRLVSPLVN